MMKNSCLNHFMGSVEKAPSFIYLSIHVMHKEICIEI